MSKDPETQVKELMSPILDVFGGADGGVAFAKLQFQFLPEMVRLQDVNPQAAELILTVHRFSRLCSAMLQK